MDETDKAVRNALAGSLCTAVVAGGILGAALWVQSQGNLPCALCVLQRMAYLGILVCALLAAAGLALGARAAARALLAAGGLFALLGIGFALRHSWLLWHPLQTCGLDPLAARINHWELTSWLPWLLRADGLCSDVPDLLGVPMPVASALGLALLGALLAAAWRLTRARQR